MSSTRKESTLGNALAACLLFVMMPSLAWINYRDFTSEQHGKVVRTYMSGQKYPSLHHVLANGQELRAWNLWFGGFSRGQEVAKYSGCFWADRAPAAAPHPWKKVLSVFLFIPAVLLPALFSLWMTFGLIESAWAAFSRLVRRGYALRRRDSRTMVPEERATATDTEDELRTGRPVHALAVVERAFGGCPTCGVEPSGAVVPCGTCGARHFESCWANHRSCNDAGCDGRPVTRRVAA